MISISQYWFRWCEVLWHSCEDRRMLITNMCLKISYELLQHFPRAIGLTHLPLVPQYVYVNRVSIGSDNGMSPIRRQAIIETNAGLLSIGPLGTNFNEILINIENFSFMKVHPKILSAKWRPFCPGRDKLKWQDSTSMVVSTWLPGWCASFLAFLLGVKEVMLRILYLVWHFDTLAPEQFDEVLLWTFSNANCLDLKENCCILFKILLKFVSKGSIDKNLAWLR